MASCHAWYLASCLASGLVCELAFLKMDLPMVFFDSRSTTSCRPQMTMVEVRDSDSHSLRWTVSRASAMSSGLALSTFHDAIDKRIGVEVV